VYTNEVIGNIMESYPAIPTFSALFFHAGCITFIILKVSKDYLDAIPSFSEKLKLSAIYFCPFALSFFAIPFLASRKFRK
jgi:hypothetical protein